MPWEKFDTESLKRLAKDPLSLTIFIVASIVVISLLITSITLIMQSNTKVNIPSTQVDTPVNTQNNSEPVKIIPGKVGDKVWEDANRNGLQDSEEKGVPNLDVNLIDTTTKESIANVKTLENGQYLFNNINPGAYEVEITIPQNMIATIFQAGQNRENDNDFTMVEQSENELKRIIRSQTFNLINGQENIGIDAGLHTYEEIKGKIWVDVNQNKAFDDQDKTAGGMIISLLDEQSNVVDSRVTNEGGQYLFNTIKAGKYSLKIESSPNFSTQDPSQKGMNLEQLTTLPKYSDLIEVKPEQKINNLDHIVYELTPEIKQKLQTAAVASPSPTDTPASPAPVVSPTSQPTQPVSPSSTPTESVQSTPTQINVETLNEGTSTGSQIETTDENQQTQTNGNSALVKTGIPIFILTILGGINLLMLKATNSDRNESQLRRRRARRYVQFN